jgi:hypothetical protein|tara:strand:+ start:939 stop:1133 length:195 start_codon:yes stop_codon:yes gene_type:complete
MNPEKWKSVVISIDTYNMLKKIAKRNHRTLSGQFTHLLTGYVDSLSEEPDLVKSKETYDGIRLS